jgi:hydrogenase small subunit
LCRVEKTPLIKLPGIPVPPHHLIGTLSHLQFVGFPRLDAQYRPELYYGETVCATCERRGDLESGRFASALGRTGCLFRLGCRGPITHNTCSSARWNGGVNWCVGAGGPCTGCAEPGYPDHGGLGLYGRVPGDALAAHSFVLENLDIAGKTLFGLTGLGIGIHLLRKKLDRAQARRSRRRPDVAPQAAPHAPTEPNPLQ